MSVLFMTMTNYKMRTVTYQEMQFQRRVTKQCPERHRVLPCRAVLQSPPPLLPPHAPPACNIRLSPPTVNPMNERARARPRSPLSLDPFYEQVQSKRERSGDAPFKKPRSHCMSSSCSCGRHADVVTGRGGGGGGSVKAACSVQRATSAPRILTLRLRELNLILLP